MTRECRNGERKGESENKKSEKRNERKDKFLADAIYGFCSI